MNVAEHMAQMLSDRGCVVGDSFKYSSFFIAKLPCEETDEFARSVAQKLVGEVNRLAKGTTPVTFRKLQLPDVPCEARHQSCDGVVVLVRRAYVMAEDETFLSYDIAYE